MLLVTLALAAAQPLPAPSTVHAVAVPCNADAMKSIACNAQRHTPTVRTAAAKPVHCNPDRLKAPACHADLALARAKARSKAGREEEFAVAD